MFPSNTIRIFAQRESSKSLMRTLPSFPRNAICSRFLRHQQPCLLPHISPTCFLSTQTHPPPTPPSPPPKSPLLSRFGRLSNVEGLMSLAGKTKSVFVDLKLTSPITLLSMLASFASFSYLFDWDFAVGVVSYSFH